MAVPSRVVLERNLRWYRIHQLPAGALFWLPTTFLFFIQEFGLSDALRIQAVYYFAVVLLEVPSGWFSDRVGRVPMLRLVAVSWLVAHSLFLLGDGLGVIVAGQVFLAMGYSFLSGTDVTFHFDTLEALGRPEEFEAREASARRNLLLVTAGSALAGGALGVVDLRLPFAASLVAAAVQLGFASRLVEPPRTESLRRFDRDLGDVVRYTRTPLLRWLVLYVVAQVIAVHLAAELAAPYLAAAIGDGLGDPTWAALANGALAAVVALVGALVLRRATALGRVVGVTTALVLVAFVPATILVVMAVVTSVWVLPLLALRGVQTSVSAVLVSSVVGSHVDQYHRATFLSLTSLAGRLGYGAVLLALGTVDELATSLRWAAAIAVGLDAATVETYSVRDGERRAWAADRVVVALPAFLRARLVVDDPVAFRPRMPPWLVANVHLLSPPEGRGVPLAWDNVLYGSTSLGYVNAMHQALPRGGAHGVDVLSAVDRPRPSRRAGNASSRWISSGPCRGSFATSNRLIVTCGRTSRESRPVGGVMRWSRPEPGTLTSVARREAQRAVGRLHFAHSDLSGGRAVRGSVLSRIPSGRRGAGGAAGRSAGMSGVVDAAGGLATDAGAFRRPSARWGPWLVSPRFDLFAFGAPAAVALLLVATRDHWAPAGETSLGFWLVAVVFIDVGHVWSTLFRTYLDPAVRARAGVVSWLRFRLRPTGWGSPSPWCRSALFGPCWRTPRCFTSCVSSTDGRCCTTGATPPRGSGTAGSIRWRSMLRPAIRCCGGMPTCPGSSRGSCPATSSGGSSRNRCWRSRGSSTGWPSRRSRARQVQRFVIDGRWRAGKILVVGTTAACWGVGIIVTNADFTFTVTNVLIHGVPYLAYIYVLERAGTAARPQGSLLRGVFVPFAGVAYFAILGVLAFGEEFLWDRTLWHERPEVFWGPEFSVEGWRLALWMPLLAVPQATHYVLDGFIWRASRPRSSRGGSGPRGV